MLRYPIPKLILQPIVENAIYHGLEMILGKGTIEIAAYHTERNTYIKVMDNGAGIPKDRLNDIQASLHQGGDLEDHIGLVNVQERIRLHYGPEYGIELRSELGKGTVVLYCLPLEADHRF